MLITQYILMLIVVLNTTTAIVIYSANPGRSQNRLLFHFCNTLTLWALFVIGIIYSQSAALAETLIRLASVTAAAIPLALALLLNSITKPQLDLWGLVRACKVYTFSFAAIAGLCATGFFLIDVSLPAPDMPSTAVAEANYGDGFPVFVAYFLIAISTAIFSSVKAMRKSQGIARTELQYVLLGAGLMLLVSFSLSLIAPLIFKTTQVQQFGPVSVIVLNTVIAYGIATKRILDVGTVIRKLVAYALLTTYLVCVYLLTWSICRFSFFILLSNPAFPAHLAAALAVAFSMAPAHGKLQSFAEKMIATKTMDIPALMKIAGDVFQTVTTCDALEQQFSHLLKTKLSSNDVRILSALGEEYEQHHPAATPADRARLNAQSSIVKMLQQTKAPIGRDSLIRMRQTLQTRTAINELEALKADLAVGFFSKAKLSGIVLFGSRYNGQIYNKSEEDALQILCNQFAVALENARLYTEVKNSKIRNEIMLAQLVSGVIVADTDRRISLFNHEAQRITGIAEADAIGETIQILPPSISHALERTLTNQSGMRNIDATLFSNTEDGKNVDIRMGTASLFGYDKNAMGALLVLTDTTELKSLEEQVRRADQLSSVGTLAAGMAHEIKNPLVTIKTFTQLLPQRYADEEFRNDFSSLVAHEVSRIDGIVNELLSFSKPAKPKLAPLNLHETIEQTLKLVNEHTSQKNILLNNRCQAESAIIRGDEKLLSQALVNLNLNAIEAIGQSGAITVGTQNCTYRFANGDKPENAKTRRCIRLQISDTGEGIDPEHLQNIFAPFFTSKSEGTGMGLSVAHGIIREHNGAIEVESEPGRGATFYIYLPLIEEADA